MKTFAREMIGLFDALTVARTAIASLGVGDLGWGDQGGLSDPYPIRDEVLSSIDLALSRAAVARYAKEDEAEEHATRLQTEFLARAALLAALDPHDSELQAVILRAMGFYSEGGDFGPMARVQAHDAIAALKWRFARDQDAVKLSTGC